jgi:hypothetical protein
MTTYAQEAADEALRAARAVYEQPDWPEPPPPTEPVYQFTPGGSFILDTDPDPQPIWGNGGQVLAADGEALIIAAGPGLGKTTLGQQLALGRCGFEEYSTLLGFPIIRGNGVVLYLAMDRPKQIARSFRRMVGEAWRDELDHRLVVWQGPPPYDLARHPALLLHLCEQAGADTVIVDSLKDAAIGLSDDGRSRIQPSPPARRNGRGPGDRAAPQPQDTDRGEARHRHRPR